ncbi:MAG TPA: membrane protein insertion efficiency factor YidD [Methylophilus sp.]|nr:membrane protein insertion efficiency factor YidD [Methylophilus sp.]HQQ32325.1 membrane protein insertion efficiency factor YidD [Methylophilus sp.]
MRHLLIGLIRLYQMTWGTQVGVNCRFSPTCSQYAIEALGRYGTIKGGYLMCARILRCHPWCSGGHDPVP